ncbi:cation:proton antiporter [Amycolatopsis sp. 195334CR]|uniref:cation:proton antiporter n=1 Tax=Amycolatopsis sp. 195334CR TaxID=2814588 RepID=UPI001A900A5B|nr:cation:proton antiporter [Amycolatopsis sp. 195334CR]MBN6038808.1 cation:proton antiporter [Amycolatopsis sp. 195334CR]
MSLQPADLARLLVAVTLLLVFAHAAGRLFAILRQPPVIGEILGGLLLGPTVLGLLAPQAQERLFPPDGPVAVGIGVLTQFGLLLLMFLAGREVPAFRGAGRNRAVVAMAVAGLAIPFAVGLGAVRLVDHTAFSGPNGSPTTFALVFGIGIAVTSIPVISRIMIDLDIMRTHFARIVLSVALLEDIVLYVALAAVLGMAQAGSGAEFGLAALFDGGAGQSSAYHFAASFLFFAVFMLLGRPIFDRLSHSRFNFIERRSATAFRLIFLLALVLVCVFLGVNPIFGAVLAGVASAAADSRDTDEEHRLETERAWDALKKVSLALFIPLYFAGVGLQLDLVHHFSVWFFFAFLLLACLVKSASVWLGARLAGESKRASVDFAVALNARGGPGIVLATVTLSAGVINEDFFTILVVLSIVTSQIAGSWLQHAFRAEPATTPAGGRHADVKTT